MPACPTGGRVHGGPGRALLQWLATIIVLLTVPAAGVAMTDAVELDRSPRDLEVDYQPADGQRVAANPPAFVWLPAGDVTRWTVEYSPKPDFSSQQTVRVHDLDMTVHVPQQPLEPGTWYWRYGLEVADGVHLSRVRSFVVTEDAVTFEFPSMASVMEAIPRTRPRVYFSTDDVHAIRSDPERYAWLVEPVVRQAEAALARQEPLFEEPRPWEEYEDTRQVYIDTWRAMRPYTRGMEVCARAYLFTGDERFAAEAKRRLMHFMTWDVDGPSSVYGPTELGMDIAQHAPRTFDWIYETLSDRERNKCVEVLGRRIRQINEMHRGLPFESRPFSSHPGRMIGFAIEGGIILAHEVADARDWLEYTLRVLWSVYPAWGDSDGGWHEGVSYWTSYISRMAGIVIELDRMGIPLRDKPFFQNTGDYGLYVAYPNRPTRAFGDSYSTPVGRGQGNLMYVLGSVYDNPYYRWHAEQAGGGPSGPTALRSRRPDLEPKAPHDLPQSKAFYDVGHVAMHSDMASPQDNVLVIFKSSPLGSISHDHANQNAFVVEAFGEPLAVSSGYYQIYGDPHHRQWVWQTRAHNAILVDGEGQMPRSAQSRGRIVTHIERGRWAYALGDAVQAYGGRLDRAYRHVLMLRPNVIIIADDHAAADGESTYQWRLHAIEEMAVSEERAMVTVKHGIARMQVRFLKPAELSFSQATGWDPEPTWPDRAPPQFHLTASTEQPAASRRFVTVLTPSRLDNNNALPSVELLDAEGGFALRVDDDIVLIRDPHAEWVREADHGTTEQAAVIRDEV